MDTIHPSPWHLTGKGYLILYRFHREFVEERGCIPQFLQGQFAGGFGCVMLVDYKSSNVGPYGELLFIPGKFRHQGKKLNTITKIYVSSMTSVINGRNNWGIPKEQAEFRFENLGYGKERIVISTGETRIADFTIDSGRLSFPVNTRLLPFPLVQFHENRYYYTTFTGKGKGRFAKVENVSINENMFPDVSMLKPITVIAVDPFAITFPVPVIGR